MNDNEKYIEEFVNDIPFDAPNEKHRDKLKNQLLNAFPKHRLQPTVHTVHIWRTIMKSRILKLAAAALIFIAVLAGLPFITNDTGVVLADVLEKVQQAQVFMYKMKMTMTGNMMPGMTTGLTDIDYTVTISNKYGMKMQMETTVENTKTKIRNITYLLPKQMKIISLLPDKKQYMEMNFDEDYVAKAKQQSNDPREIIKRILQSNYTELGQKTIDGVKVEGFQTTDPAFAGGLMESIDLKLWVDVERWLPVRTEMDFKMNEQMQMQGVIYDYQWDIEVDAGDFEPVIPEDFKAIATDLQLPKMNEEGAIEGLRFFAENSGKYPKKLDMMNLMKELSSLKALDDRTDTGIKSDEGNLQRTVETMRPAQSLMMFYMTLVQEKKEPVYYGESVGPDDAKEVLLRWKVSEGQYRVIFGDLSTLDVTAEVLAKFEKSLSEQ
ncbi:MAG: hypothetical protein ACYSW7_05420 [Planctomycetota bacterium]|jgi:outer membrane lipoprotein-sorting protein